MKKAFASCFARSIIDCTIVSSIIELISRIVSQRHHYRKSWKLLDKNSLNLLNFLIGTGVQLVGPAVLIRKLARTGMSASDVVKDAETKS